MVSGPTFRSSIHFEIIFICGMRNYSDFILLHVAVFPAPLRGVGSDSLHSFVWSPGCPETCVGLLLGRTMSQLVPGQGLAYWGVWAGWVRRLQDCGFLAFGVCHLMGEAGPEARADFLEGRAGLQEFLGLVPAHWLGNWVLGPCWTWPCPEAAVGLGGLKAACLLMGGALSPLSELLGLRCPSTGTCRLLGQGTVGS